MILLEYKSGRITFKKTFYKGKYKCFEVKCDCGKEKTLREYDFRKQITKSCGCLAKEVAKEQCSKNFKTHNLRSEHIYSVWNRIKSRCYYEKDVRYNSYGARGIIMQDNWKYEFLNFYKWAINNGYVVGLSIERIDVNKGYNESNCTWIPSEYQFNNKTTNYRIYNENSSYNLRQFSVKHDFSLSSLQHFVSRKKIHLKISQKEFLSQYLAKPRKKLLGRCND